MSRDAVGGGFAGLGCVKRLGREDGVSVTLIDWDDDISPRREPAVVS